MDAAQKIKAEIEAKTEAMLSLARRVMPPDIEDRAHFCAPAAKQNTFYVNCGFIAKNGTVFTIHFDVDKFYVGSPSGEVRYRVEASVTNKLFAFDAIRRWITKQLLRNLKAGHWDTKQPEFVVYRNIADETSLSYTMVTCLDRMDDLSYMIAAAENKLNADFSIQ